MDFQVNLNLLGWFLACILLESFIKFPVDPYYEPWYWFMIMLTKTLGAIKRVLPNKVGSIGTSEWHLTWLVRTRTDIKLQPSRLGILFRSIYKTIGKNKDWYQVAAK